VARNEFTHSRLQLLTHLTYKPNSQGHNKDSANGSMIQRVLNSKNFLAVC